MRTGEIELWTTKVRWKWTQRRGSGEGEALVGVDEAAGMARMARGMDVRPSGQRKAGAAIGWRETPEGSDSQAAAASLLAPRTKIDILSSSLAA